MVNECSNCSKNINEDNKFCSKECYYDSCNLEKECPGCGKVFKTPQSVDSKFCSEECSVENQKYQTGSECNFYKGGKIVNTCSTCDKDFKVWSKDENQKFCSQECMAEAWSDGRLKKDNHPRWRGYTETECLYCSGEFKFRSWKSRKFCSRECRSNYQSEKVTGENHPNWKGGKTEYYGSNWLRQRRKALERDNYSCRICGKSKDDLGREPSVHHIKPISKFGELEKGNNLDNLVCLCPSHHHRVEGWNLVPSNLVG